MKSINKIKLLNGEIKPIDKVFFFWGFGDNVVFDGDCFSFKENKKYVDIFFRGDNYVEYISRFGLIDEKLNFIKDHLIDGNFFRRNCEDEESFHYSSGDVKDVNSYFEGLIYLGNIHFDKLEVIENKLIELNKDEIE